MYLTITLCSSLLPVIMAVGIVPSILLRSYGWPAVQKDLEVQANSVELAKEMATHPTLAGVILYHAMTFGVVLAVYPVYVSDASFTNQDIKLMFFVFGMSRFVTLLLLLVTRISKYRSACTCTGCFDYCSRYSFYNTLFGAGCMAGTTDGRICLRCVWLREPLSCVLYHRRHVCRQQLQYLEKTAIIFRHKVLVCM